MALYKDMTSAERLKAYTDHREAVVISQDGFVARPYRGSRLDRRAWDEMAKCEREASFILRVARSCGDAWAKA